MTVREVQRKIRRNSGDFLRQGRGSREVWSVLGRCETMLAIHPGDIPGGTLRAIERDLEPCFGRRWLQRR